MPVQTLPTQYVARASWETKIRVAIYAVTMTDALGAPAEFQKRGTFPVITSMLPNGNFGLGPGIWTDDTSMTLCLARSIGTFTRKGGLFSSNKVRGGFDEVHQMEMYRLWREIGILSAIGRCFDVGGTCGKAIKLFASEGKSKKALKRIQKEMTGDKYRGNGSLFRVLPVGLAYWKDEKRAIEYAGRSSTVTHPNDMCIEVCEVWTGAIVKIMRAGVEGEKLSKLDLLNYFTWFPYRNSSLTDALSFPRPSQPHATHVSLEQDMLNHHPLLKLIQKVNEQNSDKEPTRPILPTAAELPSSGYVVHSLVAALYCFFATDSYEEGAIMAVNLGDDADTVGAIYGGLAGCWYGISEAEDNEGRFWTGRVKDWKDNLVRKDIIDEVLEELVGFTAGKST